MAETVAYLSKYFRLEAGDLIYTGTPKAWARWCAATSTGGVDGLGTLSVLMA